jgi:hypothetical protein
MGGMGTTFTMSSSWRSPQSPRGSPRGDQQGKDHQLGPPRRGADLLAARTRSLPKGELQRRRQRAKPRRGQDQSWTAKMGPARRAMGGRRGREGYFCRIPVMGEFWCQLS